MTAAVVKNPRAYVYLSADIHKLKDRKFMWFCLDHRFRNWLELAKHSGVQNDYSSRHDSSQGALVQCSADHIPTRTQNHTVSSLLRAPITLDIDLCSFINLRIHSKGKSDMTKYSFAHWGESQDWLVSVCLGSQSHQFYVVSKEEYHWVLLFQKGLLYQVVSTCSGLSYGVLATRRKGR